MGTRLVPVIPDGGWGWVVVLGSFLVHVFADGFVYSFGVLVDDIIKEFGASNAYAALIISMLTGLTLGFGPVASAVTNKYGCRTSTIVGACIATAGCAATFFANSIPFIIVSVGIVMGIGIGLMYCPAIVIVTMYFEKWRALATGIAVSGAGVGTWLFAILYGHIREKFGWRYVFIAGSVFMAANILNGLAFRPLQFIEKNDDDEEGERASPAKSDSAKEPDAKEDAALLSPPSGNRLKAVSHDAIHQTGRAASIKSALSTGAVNQEAGEGGEIRKRSGTVTEGSGYLGKKDVFYTGSITNVNEFQLNPDKYRSMTSLHSKKSKLADVKEEGDDDVFEDEESTTRCGNIGSTISRMLNLDIMMNPAFVLFALSNLLTSVGFNSPLYFLPIHAVNSLNLEKPSGDHVISVFGICNTVGRITFGIIGDRQLPLPFGLGKDTARNRLWIYNISLSLCGVLTCLSFMFKTELSLSIYSGAFGFWVSSYICLTSVILVDLLGLEKLTNAFGLLLLFQGVGTVFGPPLAGFLADATGGNYNYSFLFAGVNLLISGLMMFAAPCLRKGDSAPASNGQHKAIPLH